MYIQEHLDSAIGLVCDKQVAKEKVVKWQERREVWAHYVRNKVKGHMEIHGPHVEQNHASLKAIVEDDVTRSLEQNIVDVMRRTGLLLQKRQSLKYKWEVEAANELKMMDVIRRGHLTQPRSELSQLPYNYWVKQYDDHSSYNVENVVTDGVHGALVIHTSNSNNGYFIPDNMVGGEGEECPCDDEWSMNCGCRHFIAKRIFRGEQPYCRPNIHLWHLFAVELPLSKAGNAMNHSPPTVEYFGEDSNNDISSDLQSSPSKPQASQLSDNFGSSIANSVSVVASPSKLRSSNMNNNLTPAKFASKKPDNIGYGQLLTEGTKLANLSAHLSNEHIHVVYSMLVGMNKVVETGDHDPNNHKGKAL